jgi:hypothetical protein
MSIVVFSFNAFYEVMKTGGSVPDAIAAYKKAKKTIAEMAAINRDEALVISTVYIAKCDDYYKFLNVFSTLQAQKQL